MPHVQYRTDGTPTAPELEEAIQTIYKLSQGTNIDKVGDSLITTLEFYTPDAIDRVMLKKLALQIFNATGLIEYIADSPNCTWYTNKEPVRPLTPFPTAQPGRRAIKPASVWTDPYTHYVLPQLEPVETESRNSKNTVKMSS